VSFFGNFLGEFFVNVFVFPQTTFEFERVCTQCRIKVGAIDAAALGPLLKIGPAEN